MRPALLAAALVLAWPPLSCASRPDPPADTAATARTDPAPPAGGAGPAPDDAAAAPLVPAPAPETGSTTDVDAVFAKSISPLLMSRCSPCHAPGGKMYGTMPFDEGKTIRDHSAGVLKRFKGDDRAAIEAWLASGPTAAAH